MAGRKPLTLTDSDYFELLRHIRQLPFKRKCEQKLTDLFEDEEKSSLTSFSADDYEVLKNVLLFLKVLYPYIFYLL